MKECYVKPEIQTAYFMAENIITASGETARTIMENEVQTKLAEIAGDSQQVSDIICFAW